MNVSGHYWEIITSNYCTHIKLRVAYNEEYGSIPITHGVNHSQVERKTNETSFIDALAGLHHHDRHT